MKVDFTKLLVVQQKVDEIIMDRAAEKPIYEMIYFAMLTEFFEFVNKIGTWKWWKKNHKQDKEDILDELADIIAFFLSLSIARGSKELNVLDEGFEEIFNQYENMFPETNLLLAQLVAAIEMDIINPPEAFLLAAVFIAHKEVDATWDEIEDAYLAKSQENINRQKSDY